MPTRDQRSASSIQYAIGRKGAKTTHSLARMLGLSQYISALNNTGIFIPGTFRANPVVIRKQTASCTPADFSKDRREVSPGVFQEDSIGGHLGAWAAYWLDPWAQTADYDFSSSAAGLSLQRAYTKMYEPDFDVGMIVGELRETISGFSTLGSGIRDLIRQYNRLKKSGRSLPPSATLNMLTGEWLEFRYGIMPLIYTAQDLIKHVEDGINRLGDKLLRKRGRVRPADSSIELTLEPKGFVSNYTIGGSGTLSQSYSMTSSVMYKLTRRLTFRDIYGLNLHDLPRIVWELTTLSFVWDWFFGIGDWLESFTIDSSRRVMGSTTSLKATTTFQLAGRAYHYGKPARCGKSDFTLESQILDRRVNQTLPSLPVMDPSALSLKRQIDAISLIWQRLPKLRR